MAADPSGSGAQQKRFEREMRRREAELSRQSVEVSSGGGLVRVRVDGHGVLRSLEIAPDVFAGRDPDLLADLIMSAIADAQRRVDDLAAATELRVPDAVQDS